MSCFGIRREDWRRDRRACDCAAGAAEGDSAGRRYLRAAGLTGHALDSTALNRARHLEAAPGTKTPLASLVATIARLSPKPTAAASTSNPLRSGSDVPCRATGVRASASPLARAAKHAIRGAVWYFSAFATRVDPVGGRRQSHETVYLMRPSQVTAVLAAGLGVVYAARWRRLVLTWGATDQEAGSRLPGDELLEDADGLSTRAIEIGAPAAAVWPWLAQMGPSPRGGAYTYDWIENLFGLNMHSADTVLPSFQHPEVGETIGLGANRMRLERVEPERVLAWHSEDGNWVWTFVLREDGAKTRLISRNRVRLPSLASRVGMLPMEPGSLVMERKMLLGIKKRAEELVSQA